MSAAHFDRFLQSFVHEGADARDDLDLEALDGLDDVERDRAELLLLGTLARDDDRAVVGLGALRARRALPALRARLDELRDRAATPSAQRLLIVASAVWRIDADPAAFEAMVDVLQRCPIFTVRRAAADALTEVRTAEASQALLAAQLDAEGLVRHAAALALLRMHGAPTSPPPPLVWQVMSPDPATRDQGTRELIAAALAHPL